jgi:hypothetical protein
MPPSATVPGTVAARHAWNAADNSNAPASKVRSDEGLVAGFLQAAPARRDLVMT